MSSRSTLPKEDKPSQKSGCEGGLVGSHCERASHTVSPNCVRMHCFNRLFDPVLSVSLRCPFSSNQVAEGVCMCVFKYTAQTENILETERKRQTLTESLDAVTKSPPRRYLCWILTL